MKKQKWGIITMVAALCLTGCGSTIELDERQNAEAAEYIAGVLLKYSSNYDKSLIYSENVVTSESTIEPVVTPVVTEKPVTETGTNNGENSENGTENTDVQKIVDTNKTFSIPGFQFACAGKKACKEYKQKNAKSYAVYANENEKLVVVTMNVKNTTSSDKMIKLKNKGFSYRLVTSDGKSYNAQITGFDNDMQFLNTKVKAGKKKECVVVFSVPKKTKLNDCQLNISKGSSAATLMIE